MDYNDLSTVFSIIGLPLTLVQFWQTERQKSHDSQRRDADATVQDYLEWLRREGHASIIERLELSESATNELRDVVTDLQSSGEEQTLVILNALAKMSAQIARKYKGYQTP